MQYKKGEWMWILAMGSTIGVIAALTATGWFNALASAFIVTMIFDGVAYLAVRIGHVKMSEMSNFVMTLITAGAFYLGFKWIYPSVLKQYVGTLVPLSIVGCGISGGGCFGSNIGPVIQSSPGWYAVIAFVFFVLIAAFHGGWGKEKWDTPLLTATLAVGVVTLSVVTILTALMPWFWGTLVNADWFPPLAPFIGLWWVLAAGYIVLGLGLWYQHPLAWWIYLFVQIIALTYSAVNLNGPSVLFSFLLIGYLWLAKRSFGVNLKFSKKL